MNTSNDINYHYDKIEYLPPIVIDFEKEDFHNRCYEFNTGEKRIRWISYRYTSKEDI